MMDNYMMPDMKSAKKVLAGLLKRKDLTKDEKMKAMRKACTVIADGKSGEYNDCMVRNKERMM